MNLKQLRAVIQGLPDDTLVLVDDGEPLPAPITHVRVGVERMHETGPRPMETTPETTRVVLVPMRRKEN